MLLQSTSPDKGKSSWIPDLGASFHVTGESLNIKQHQQFDGPDKVFIGNGAALRCIKSFTLPLLKLD